MKTNFSFGIITKINLVPHEKYLQRILHMELAEWLVRGAPELVSGVRHPARSSTIMMSVIHLYKNSSCNSVASKQNFNVFLFTINGHFDSINATPVSAVHA